jgi:predicted TIM-barrel fold metal-dependent hydrolase
MTARWWMRPVVTIFFSLFAGMAFAGDLYFVDASSKADEKMGDLDEIVRLMDRHGVYRTLLTSNFHLRDIEIRRLAKKHPERIIPMVRLSGRSYEKWQHDVATGFYRGMGEMLVYHAAKKSPLFSVGEHINSLDGPAVRDSFALAKKQGWPYVVHIEYHSLSWGDQTKYRNELTKLLTDNKGVPVVLIHLAQLRTDEAEPLLEANPNLYLMTSHCNPSFLDHMPFTPYENMFSGYSSLTSAWTKLVLRFPDRFVFALDNVYYQQYDWYGDQIFCWRSALEKLPPEVAHAFAHGNAERLWRLPPKPENIRVSP